MNHRLTFALAWLFVQTLRLIPVGLCADMMGWLWRHLAPLNKRHKRAEQQLAEAMPELNETQRAEILGDMWENLGRVVAEGLHLDRLARMPNLIETPPPALMAEVQKTGGVVLSMHGGNWELISIPAAQAGWNTMGVYQAVQNPLINRYIHKLRAPFWPAGLLTKGHGTARALLAHVRKGGIIGMLADTREHKGINVPFFGRPAPTNSFPAMVAVREGKPIYAARVVRLDKLKFRAELVQIEFEMTEDFDQTVHNATAAVQAQFEAWIRQYPAQWMWGHRRWN